MISPARRLWEHRVEGLDFSVLRGSAEQEPGYPPPARIRPDAVAAFLCAPEPAFSIDLERDEVDSAPGRLTLRREVVADGVEHGVALFFVAHFDEANRLTNAPRLAGSMDGRLANPESAFPREYWYPLLLRTEARERSRGEAVQVDFVAPSLERPDTWSWTVTGAG